MYIQVLFTIDQVLALAPQHPEWKKEQPYKTILAGDKEAMRKFTRDDFEKIVIATNNGITPAVFQKQVKTWLSQRKHPRWNRPYTELAYQPMLEVLSYLRANQFKNYIVTGSNQDFVRVYAETVYGIPPEQVIGSTLKTRYTYDKQGQATLVNTGVSLIRNNFEAKPESIHLFIGQRPVAATGNSTGDQQMLEYTQVEGKPLLMMIHHDDAKREYAYGSHSTIGPFPDSLMAEAKARDWIVVSIKNDWKRVFNFEK
jgi:hypothetical protein